MAKLWTIADTHFNHRNLVVSGVRKQNYEADIITNWARLVAPEDTVIHLGDVIFSRVSELAGILSSLPGTKILVRGNHDFEKDSWYEKKGFSLVTYTYIKEYKLEDVLYSHEPDLSKWGDWGPSVNIHGHLHSGDHRLAPLMEIPEFVKRREAGYYRLVNIDQILAPQLVEDVLSGPAL